VNDTDEPVQVSDEVVALLEESRSLGFLGPGPVMFHVEHATTFARLVGDTDDVIDLGCGGGLPGLILIDHLPHATFLLLDAQQRRCAFLERAVDALGASKRVDVRCQRAEVAARDPELRGRFDCLVSRSFGSPAVTVECGSPFVRVGGRLLISEPPGLDDAISRWSVPVLDQLGLKDDGLAKFDGGGFVRRLEVCRATPDSYPRRVGVPGKRPLF
jgi:16S rRNA (guanine527-N7)-methyltransferase